MKKQLFSFLLSTALFTTNPLFAMDEYENQTTRSPALKSAASDQIVKIFDDKQVVLRVLIARNNELFNDMQTAFNM